MKTSLFILFLGLLSCKMFQFPADGSNLSWWVVTAPIWAYLLFYLFSFVLMGILRRRKNRQSRIEDKDRWNQRMEELKRSPPEPIKFKR